MKRIPEAKKKVVSFIKQEVPRGRKVQGYAASTKENTTLQFYGPTTDLIESIVDQNPQKQGKFTVGTVIPVVSEESPAHKNPITASYCYGISCLNLSGVRRFMLKHGGKFIVSMPEFRVIGG